MRVPAVALKHRLLGEPELALLTRLVDRNRGAVDVGANQGAYTWRLARLCRRVWAFEPYPALAAMLREWAPRHVEVHELLLSDHAGSLELVVPCFGGRPEPGQASAAPWAWVRRLPTVERLRCRADCLDAVLDGDVGFIKIDVEGMERQVLEGGQRTLRRSRPVLLIEIEPRHQPGPVGELFGRLTELGYNAAYLWRGVLRELDPVSLARSGEASGPPPWPDGVRNFIFRPRRR
jgi:FkbM family methyltransferase